MLAQYADHDPDRQRAFLDALRGVVAPGEASPAHLAYLEDRVRVQAGQPQLYGIQLRHELYLMCGNIDATFAELRGKGAEVARDVFDQGWGLLAAIRLPDSSEFPIYQPQHPSPPSTLTGRTHLAAVRRH